MIFHFQKCTCNKIRNPKQYESISASILFFRWLLQVRFAISVVEAYHLQRCNLDHCLHLSCRTLQHYSVAKIRYYCTAIHLRGLQGSWVRLWFTKESFLTKCLSYYWTLRQWYLKVLFVKLCDNKKRFYVL